MLDVHCGTARDLMTDNDDWIARRVTDATNRHAAVTPGAAAQVRELLKGALSERQQNATELKALAVMLLAQMVPTQVTSKAKP